MLALAKLRHGLYRLVALLAMLFHVSINFDSDKKSSLYPPSYEVRLSRYHWEVKVTSTVLTFSPVFLFSVLFFTIWSPTILSLYKFVRITGAFKENICNDLWCIDGLTVWCSLSQLKRRFPQTVVRMQNSLLFVNTNIHTWWNYTEFPMTCHAGWLYTLCCGFVGTSVLCPTQAGIYLIFEYGLMWTELPCKDAA